MPSSGLCPLRPERWSEEQPCLRDCVHTLPNSYGFLGERDRELRLRMVVNGFVMRAILNLAAFRLAKSSKGRIDVFRFRFTTPKRSAMEQSGDARGGNAGVRIEHESFL